MGNCLAGDTCIFSHDPANLVNQLSLDEATAALNSQQIQDAHANFQSHDFSSIFPSLQSSLQPMMTDHWQHAFQSPADAYIYPHMFQASSLLTQQPGFQSASLHAETAPQHSRMRPVMRGQPREPIPSVPSVDDTEAFPSLGSANIKGTKKNHGKRGGHGHINKENKELIPSSMADVVRMAPSQTPASPRKGLKSRNSYTGTRENSAAAQAIPSPQHIPWLETGDRANTLYLKARQDAIKHGGLRNKFLQRYSLSRP